MYDSWYYSTLKFCAALAWLCCMILATVAGAYAGSWFGHHYLKRGTSKPATCHQQQLPSTETKTPPKATAAEIVAPFNKRGCTAGGNDNCPSKTHHPAANGATAADNKPRIQQLSQATPSNAAITHLFVRDFATGHTFEHAHIHAHRDAFAIARHIDSPFVNPASITQGGAA